MIPDFSGDFVNVKSTKDGDKMVILDEGKVEYNDILKKDMFNVKVELNGKEKVWSPTNKQGSTLQDAYGLDTKNWVGKTIEIIHVDGKMAIRPVKAK